MKMAKKNGSLGHPNVTKTIGCGGEENAKNEMLALAANRTRGPSMATMDFTTKPPAPLDLLEWRFPIWVHHWDGQQAGDNCKMTGSEGLML